MSKWDVVQLLNMIQGKDEGLMKTSGGYTRPFLSKLTMADVAGSAEVVTWAIRKTIFQKSGFVDHRRHQMALPANF